MFPVMFDFYFNLVKINQIRSNMFPALFDFTSIWNNFGPNFSNLGANPLYRMVVL